jgi:hypothetical protein
MTATTRVMLHVIHSMFLLPETTGIPNVKDPGSMKKLDKGDGCWATKKDILEYMLDGVDGTVQPPP